MTQTQTPNCPCGATVFGLDRPADIYECGCTIVSAPRYDNESVARLTNRLRDTYRNGKFWPEERYDVED